MADHDTLISNFCELTGASAQKATEYLTSSNWNIDTAVTSYFADMEEDRDQNVPQPEVAPAYTGPRTLDGRPAPQYATSSSAPKKKPQKRTGLATLSSIRGSSHDHSDDDEDDEDEDERRGPRDLFAGGEKSGLAVQDPAQRSSDSRRLIDDIVNQARTNARQHRDEPAPSRGRFFRGTGHVLGGDGVESREIPDPLGNPIPTATRSNEPVQERVLHIWHDGFSVDDGPLHRYDDPRNQEDLQMIRQGRAPLHLMNVQVDQRVDVKLQQHDEKYRPLPKVYRPFSGQGRRLGSPVPGEVTPSVTTTAAPAASTVASTSATPSTGADESQPTLMLRIQLPDGTRLPARFNTTQTVGDVYDFITRASASLANSARPWVLSTTFPNKEHEDKGLVLGEMPEFKRGGTAVVKWK